MQQDNISMREMPVSERPYERFMKYGSGSLSDAELLAVMLRTGDRGCNSVEMSKRLIAAAPGKSLSGLMHMSVEELMDQKGIGQVKAIQIKCLAEITKRLMMSGSLTEKLICSGADVVAAHYMSEFMFLDTEMVVLLILDGKNACTSEVVVSKGGFDSAFCSPREIFFYAFKYKAVRILLMHNHPSGDPDPSGEDITLTDRLNDAGSIMGIELVDHIIIGGSGYFSFKENGYLT